MCCAEPRSEAAGWRATCYYSSEFEKWLWCLPSAILTPSPPPSSPSSFLLPAHLFQWHRQRWDWGHVWHAAKERNISPRLMSAWTPRAGENANGSIPWLACSCQVTGQVSLWQIHQDGPHTDTGAVSLMLIYISVAATSRPLFGHLPGSFEF